MSHPGKHIRVWDKSTNPGFDKGKAICVMHVLHCTDAVAGLKSLLHRTTATVWHKIESLSFKGN